MRKGFALATAFACTLALSSSATADSVELLSNGTFEGSSGSGSLAGWTSQNATLSLVTATGAASQPAGLERRRHALWDHYEPEPGDGDCVDRHRLHRRG